MATVTGCEYHATPPEIVDDIVNVTGPFLDKTCDGGCDPNTGKLQFVYRSHVDTGSEVCPIDNLNNCGEWMDSARGQQTDLGAEAKQAFYGTLAEFWDATWPDMSCPLGPYGSGNGATLCCNTRTGANNNTVKQKLILTIQEWYGLTFNWTKRMVQIDDFYPMGEL